MDAQALPTINAPESSTEPSDWNIQVVPPSPLPSQTKLDAECACGRGEACPTRVKDAARRACEDAKA